VPLLFTLNLATLASAMGTEIQGESPPPPTTGAMLFNARQREALLRMFTLTLICLVSFSIRLFSVLRFESIIHEFDPWFNFRSTRYAYKPFNFYAELRCRLLHFTDVGLLT